MGAMDANFSVGAVRLGFGSRKFEGSERELVGWLKVEDEVGGWFKLRIGLAGDRLQSRRHAHNAKPRGVRESEPQ